MFDITGLANTNIIGSEISDNDISNIDISGNDVSGNDISGNDISGNDISDNDKSGNDVSGNDISDNDNSDNDVSGNDISGNDISDNDISDNDISGNDISYNDISGNDISGNDVSGNDISGNDISGNDVSEDVAETSSDSSASVVVDKESEDSLTKKPARPQLGYGSDNNQKIVISSTTVSIKMTAASGCKIYYTLDGKNPTFKKGAPSTNAQLYSGAIKIGNQSKVVVKAIAVNAAGLCSPVMTHTFTFKPAVTKITLSALGSTSSTNAETGVTTISVNLVKGKSLQLNAAYTPVYAVNKNLTWEIISKPDSAGNGVKLSNKGKITTTKNAVAGTYKVKATLKSNTSVSATINVKVVDEAKVKSLKVSQKTISLTTKGTTSDSCNLFSYLVINATTTMKATDFIWTSSNTSVATVTTSGVVKSVAGQKGKAVITVTAKDGSGKQAKFTVNVNQLATSVTISGENKLGVGNSITLKATVAPAAAASQKVKWEIIKYPTGADEAQVKINAKGKLTATKKAAYGSYTIKATALDGSGKSGTYAVTVQSAIQTVRIESENFTLYRVSGSDSIGAMVSKTVPVTAMTTERDSSTNLEVLNNSPGIVTATYNTSTKKLTVKATGTGTGTATITVQAKDGSKKKASIKVTVVNPPSSITIQLPNGSTGDLAINHNHKPKVIIGTKYGNPGKVKVTWSLAKDNENIVLNSSTGSLKIKNTVSAGSTFTLKATVDGNLTLSGKIVCTARTKIKNLEVHINGDKIIGEPIAYCNKMMDVDIRVRQVGKQDLELASASNLSTTKNITLTASSDNLGLSYNSKKATGTIKSTVPGKYKITVKALDGTGKSKTYKIRVK